MFCLIDQRSKTCSGLDGWLETFRSLTGVVMAIIIMSHYRWDSLRHIRKYMSENESRKKTFISSYSYIYILYICTHINGFKLKEKQYG